MGITFDPKSAKPKVGALFEITSNVNFVYTILSIARTKWKIIAIGKSQNHNDGIGPVRPESVGKHTLPLHDYNATVRVLSDEEAALYLLVNS